MQQHTVSKLQVCVRQGRRSTCVTARGKGDNSLSQKAFSPRCPCFIFRYSLPIVLKACVQNEQLYFALTGEMFPASQRGMMYCRLTRAARLDHHKCFKLWESYKQSENVLFLKSLARHAPHIAHFLPETFPKIFLFDILIQVLIRSKFKAPDICSHPFCFPGQGKS